MMMKNEDITPPGSEENQGRGGQVALLNKAQQFGEAIAQLAMSELALEDARAALRRQSKAAETEAAAAASHAARADQLEKQLRYLQRPLVHKWLLRPNGRPVRAVRRIFFHSSGRPRDRFRRFILDDVGLPRPFFAQWMSSPDYLCKREALLTERPARVTQEQMMLRDLSARSLHLLQQMDVDGLLDREGPPD